MSNSTQRATKRRRPSSGSAGAWLSKPARIRVRSALPLAEAALALDVSKETLRRWVREEGCPAVQGGPGVGKGYRVDVEAARRWQAERVTGRPEATLREIARVMLDFFKRGREP